MNREVSDAIRTVTAKMQNAIASGHRSRSIDADDLVEVLLSIADELDPAESVPARRPGNECPDCGGDECFKDDCDPSLNYCSDCGTVFGPLAVRS